IAIDTKNVKARFKNVCFVFFMAIEIKLYLTQAAYCVHLCFIYLLKIVYVSL
ncbi:MAG: hypothetical protein RLZZ337_1749, partial [Bacteroidota bacterium]